MYTGSSPNALIYSAQYLRFLAASLVIIVHAAELTEYKDGAWVNYFAIGAAGVDIFFVLSGFIITVISQARKQTPLEFMTNRAVRIAPPYMAVTLLMAFVVFFMPGLFNSSTLDLPHLTASFFFIAWPHPIKGDAMPLYFPGWTLNYEMFFYIIFSTFLFMSLRLRAFAVAAVISALVLLGLALQPDNEIFIFYTKPIMLEFLFGVGIGCLYLRWHEFKGRWADWSPYFLLIAGVAGFVLAAMYGDITRLSPDRALFWGVPAALMVAGGVFLETRGKVGRNQTLRILGDASYAAYLVHLFVIGAFGKVWNLAGLNETLPQYMAIILSFIACWIVACLFHFLFELPVIAVLKKLLKKRKPQPA